VRYDASRPGLALSVQPDQLQSHFGIFPIVLTLTDKAGTVKQLKFNLKVMKFEAETKTSERKPSNLPPPKPYILEHNQIGKLKVGFTRPILLPTFERFPEFLENKRKDCSNGGFCRRLQLVFEEE
jgi:hypothetical protein